MRASPKRNAYRAGVITGLFITITMTCFKTGSYVTGTLALVVISMLYMGTLGDS